MDYGKQLVTSGLVQGTWGNLSVRLDDTYMLVTPSGLDYARLTPADMVKVNMRTLAYEGDLKPTSEKSLHAAIYHNRPDIGGIIHTHAKYCCVYAAARRRPADSDRSADCVSKPNQTRALRAARQQSPHKKHRSCRR